MAYLNFQNCTRQEYEQVMYSGDARNKLKLLFNNVELQNADRYCERMTVKSRIVPNGAKIFSLNNFISKEVELILHDIDTSIIQDQVSISIGTLVGNNYEYVPIGIFNIENQPTNDKNKTTIKLRDNSVKFDFNYNAQPLIEENGGSATKLQILQDICTQAGVTCNITSFIGYLDEIGIYDNTITARKYIADIAEQAGKMATINRSGELIFVDLNNLATWEIPIEVVEKYESGTKFKVGKVVYEDGIVRYETEDSNDDTLFLDGSNDYINGELIKEQASSNNNTYSLNNTSQNGLHYLEIFGKTIQNSVPSIGKNLICVGNVVNQLGVSITKINNSEIMLNGTFTTTGVITIPLIYGIKLDDSTYTLRLNTSGNASGNFTINLPESNSFRNIAMPHTSVTKNSNLEDGRIYKNLRITIANRINFDNFYIQIQLQNSGTSSFEPFTMNTSDLISIGTFNDETSKYDIEITNTKGNLTNTQTYSLSEPLRSINTAKDKLYMKNGYLFVQRNIGYIDSYNGTNITTNYMSTSGKIMMGLPIQYILNYPIIEELGQITMPIIYNESDDMELLLNMQTNSYIQYSQPKTQVEAILDETNQFDIDSLKTGKILGNPAIDSYDLIQIHDTYKDETYTTLATNDLVYTGVLINTFDTQIGEEAKEQNVFVNGEETFKKWARTKIDNVEGTLTLQAGEINEVNGKINSTTLQINSQGALLNVLANKSNIDVEYDSEGNPLNGEVREVTTTTGFKFNAEGMTIEDSSSNFKALHRNDGTYYKEGDNVVGQYTKDGSKQKDLELFGVYYYGKNNWPDTPMFVAQIFTDGNGDEGFGHFYNRGD